MTKWVGSVTKPSSSLDFARRAFTQLRSGRPGPVLLVVPPNLGEYDEAEYPYTPVKGWKSAPDPDDVKAAVRRYYRPRTPASRGRGCLLWPGDRRAAAVRRADSSPCVDHPEGQERVPGEPPSAVVRPWCWPNIFSTSATCCSPSVPASSSTGQPCCRCQAHKTIVQCTVDTLDINRSYETSYAVIGDAKFTLQALIQEFSAQTGGVRARIRRCSMRSRRVRRSFWPNTARSWSPTRSQ